MTHQILSNFIWVDLLWRLEIRVEFVDQVAEGRLEHSIDNVDNQVFQPVQQVGEVDEGTLGLQMRVLGNMPSCAGLKKNRFVLTAVAKASIILFLLYYSQLPLCMTVRSKRRLPVKG